MQLTFEDLLWFVIRNKSDKSFKGMSVLQIATQLKVGLDKNSLWYKEVNGKIVGMVLADIDRERKILFIKENLSMSIFNLREFAARAKKEFVGYTIQFYKHGRYYSQNIMKLLTKIGA